MAEESSGVIQKAAVLLRQLADAGSEGLRLKDLAKATGLARPTVHRLLAALQTEGLVRQTGQRRYVLGRQMFELGLSAPNPIGQLERFRPLIRDLAVSLGDVVYFSMRRGGTMHYLLREAGAYPIRTYTVDIGELRRITTSYSGLAMLAALPPAAAAQVVASTVREPEGSMRSLRQVARLRKDFDAHGYIAGADLVLDGVAGISGVAVPVPNPRGSAPFLALSVSAITQRLPPERYPVVAVALKQTADSITDLLDEAN